MMEQNIYQFQARQIYSKTPQTGADRTGQMHKGFEYTGADIPSPLVPHHSYFAVKQ